MVYDAKIDKPQIDQNGVSDPVAVFTDKQEVLVAWWNEKDLKWHTSDEREDISVLYWSKIEFPHGWFYDASLYGGAE